MNNEKKGYIKASQYAGIITLIGLIVVVSSLAWNYYNLYLLKEKNIIEVKERHVLASIIADSLHHDKLIEQYDYMMGERKNIIDSLSSKINTLKIKISKKNILVQELIDMISNKSLQNDSIKQTLETLRDSIAQMESKLLSKEDILYQKQLEIKKFKEHLSVLENVRPTIVKIDKISDNQILVKFELKGSELLKNINSIKIGLRIMDTQENPISIKSGSEYKPTFTEINCPIYLQKQGTYYEIYINNSKEIFKSNQPLRFEFYYDGKFITAERRSI